MKQHMILLCLLFLCGGYFALGQDKASQSRLDKFKSGVSLPKLMDAPDANFARIRIAFLSGKDDGYVDVRRHLEMTQAQSDETKAACFYLAAACNRAEAMAKASENRNGFPLRELPAKSLPILLDSFRLCPASKASLQRQIRRDILVLLMDDEGMAMINDDLRKRVVDEYVHSPGSPLDSEGYETQIPVFRNLGILDELSVRCSANPCDIKNKDMLFDTMRLAFELYGAGQAIPYADELARRTGIISLKKQSARQLAVQRAIMEVYIEADPTKMLDSFNDAFKNNPLLGEYLYVASYITGKPDGDERRIDKWLRPFLMARINVNGDATPDVLSIASDFSRLAAKLISINDFVGALHVCEFSDNLKSIEMLSIRSHLVFQKAICLEKLGRLQDARNAYLECTKTRYAEYAHVEEAKKRLSNLGEHHGED